MESRSKEWDKVLKYVHEIIYCLALHIRHAAFGDANLVYAFITYRIIYDVRYSATRTSWLVTYDAGFYNSG